MENKVDPPLSPKEILSNFQMFKSSRQQDAVKTNPYLRGFGEAIEELLTQQEVVGLDDKNLNANYFEGRLEALRSMMWVKDDYGDENAEKLLVDLGGVLSSSVRRPNKKRL